ncbi:hypothetical protein [Aquitalea sp. USM4]|uniref:hypothetical protein n=1 Tax=Aquitalea sp. USM4 TaxID=1590041 RepID=UPI00103C437E|nr:hypothetical protein [Aquitalea sp. USM4]QBJ80490.1 hypothetical protein DKK66_19775 [Aquitalea sp. USM4]
MIQVSHVTGAARFQFAPACHRKGAYSTIKRAKQAASECQKKGSGPLFVYKCPYCRDYHLTHQNYGVAQ